MFLRTKTNVKGGQKFNRVEVGSIITRCSSFIELKKITARSPRFHVSVTSERVGGWVECVGTCVLATLASYIHSSITLLTALLTHGICFFFTCFSFYYQCLEKIIFVLTVPCANLQ